MKDLAEKRAALVAQMEAIKNQIVGIDFAIQILKGETGNSQPADEPRKRTRRGSVKDTVLDLLTEAADEGLSANACVDVAKEKSGLELDRGSVSSLLSRLKKDGIVFYDGERYRLKKYAGPRSAA